MIELPEVTVSDARAWRAWLSQHHAASGAWLRIAKKGTTEPTSLSYTGAVEEALCFGWIDGQSRRADAATYWVRFTPRRPRSHWTQTNVQLVERLTRERRMHPAGLAAIDRARADGRA